MRYAVCCALLVASCQTKEATKRDSTGSAATGSATPSSPGATSPGSKPDGDAPLNKQPRLPLPPLPDPLPGARQDLTAAIGTAARAAIGDFDGDGDRELVVVDAQRLRIVERTGKEIASTPVSAGIQVLVAEDIDGDGRTEILAGWGMSREHRAAKARITLHRLNGATLAEEVIVEPDTPRADVTAIVPMPDAKAVLVAYFDSKYNVTSAIARRTGQTWELEKLASIRMATSYARGDLDGDGTPELVVGRMYGDDLGADGDAFVLAPDGTRTMLPSTRGLRSLAVLGGEVFMADGWHHNYGQHARALLTSVVKAKDGFAASLVENTPGQHSLERIVPATIDGKPALVTLGSHYVRVFAKTGGTWRGLTIAGAASDVAVGDLDGKPGDEIVVVGDQSELVDLRGVAW